MPILKRRHDYVKLYRPNGAKYAEARNMNLNGALDLAMAAFFVEFGRRPVQEKTYVEIMGVTADWVVTVFEIEDV